MSEIEQMAKDKKEDPLTASEMQKKTKEQKDDTTESSVHYWLVYVENEETRKRRYKQCGTDLSAAIAASWQGVGDEDTHVRMLDKDDEEYKALQSRATEQQRYFAWTWSRRGHFHCFYVLQGDSDSVLDDIDVDEHFKEWGND